MPREAASFCRFCIALCGIRVTVEGDTVVSVKGDPDHPASRGYTCTKGRSLGRWHHHPGRLLAPKVRHAGGWRRAAWSDAIADVARLIGASIERHGADSVGAYIGTAASLDGAGKWAAERFVTALGSRSKYSAISIDTPCKPLVSLLMSGHPGLVPVVDDRACTLTAFVGSNPVVSHGHLNGFPDPVVRLRAMAAAPRELWVIDPRTTESARLATRHLAPRPGTDFAILAHLIRELLGRGGADLGYLAAHATAADVATLRAVVEEWTPERASEVTGCAAADLADLVVAVRRHGRVAFQTGTGTTMSAAANVTEWLVWALHVVTGSYDAPGGMWFNPGLLRRSELDLVPNPAVPTPTPGPPSRPELPTWVDEYPCAALADEVEAGHLRVLVVFGGNPMTAFPNPERVRRALAMLDALVVLDVVDTETTEVATHVLPTTGQLERADLPYYYDQFSLDRSTQFTPAVVAPVGEARGMWRIAAQLAEATGRAILPAPLTTRSRDEDVLRHLAGRATASFDDVAARRYVAEGPTYGWVRDGVLPGGRWRLAPRELVAQLSRWRDLVPPPGPLLTCRREPRHLNSQRPAVPDRGAAGPTVVLHPGMAASHAITDGDVVSIGNAHGSVRAPAALDPDLHPDLVSITHGWSAPNVSALASERPVDELTGMPVQTAIPVSLERRGGGAE